MALILLFLLLTGGLMTSLYLQYRWKMRWEVLREAIEDQRDYVPEGLRQELQDQYRSTTNHCVDSFLSTMRALETSRFKAKRLRK